MCLQLDCQIRWYNDTTYWLLGCSPFLVFLCSFFFLTITKIINSQIGKKWIDIAISVIWKFFMALCWPHYVLMALPIISLTTLYQVFQCMSHFFNAETNAVFFVSLNFTPKNTMETFSALMSAILHSHACALLYKNNYDVLMMMFSGRFYISL